MAVLQTVCLRCSCTTRISLDVDGAPQYVDYVMDKNPPFKVHFGSMWPRSRARVFEVHGLGYREVFKPKIVNRPGGTRDWLLMQFHSAVSVFASGEMVDYPPETLVLWEPGAAHRYGREDRSWSHSWLHCDSPGIEAVIRASRIPLNRPFGIGNAAIVDEILPAIHAELTGNRRPDPVILEDLVEIMVRRLRRVAPGGAAESVPSRVLAARAYLDRNLASQLRLDRLAQVVGMSASHLSAEFRQHFGVPPMRYLLEQRLRRAAYLLADRNAGVGEVARAVGFNDARYLSRQFRKRFGASPREYRRQHRG